MYRNNSAVTFERNKRGYFFGLAVFICAYPFSAHAQQSCAPSSTTCTPDMRAASQQVAPPPVANAVGCPVPGQWKDSFRGAITVGPKLTGTIKYPYCSISAPLKVTLNGNTGFNVAITWQGGSECQSSNMFLTFGENCNVASGTFVNADGRTGSVTWKKLVNSLKVSPVKTPKIPTDSRVSSGKVLTRDDLTLVVTDSTKTPVAGITVSLKSDRDADTITQPTVPTDANGTTTARVETRDQSSSSTITSASSELATGSPGVISWLPAHFESDFLVTCYVISEERIFSKTKLISNVPGLPPKNKYRQGFIADTKVQGSGLVIDGSYIHYNLGTQKFNIDSCARTATLDCAEDGKTLAVDPKVIPKRSTVAIDSVGSRVALDTGGKIKGYHVDVFYGLRRTECLNAGKPTLGVDFTNY